VSTPSTNPTAETADAAATETVTPGRAAVPGSRIALIAGCLGIAGLVSVVALRAAGAVQTEAFPGLGDPGRSPRGRSR
jgi:hypothetical protein